MLLCLFLQLLRRHGGTALFYMGNNFVQGKIWDHPSTTPKGSEADQLLAHFGTIILKILHDDMNFPSIL